ncbi:DUF4105 domain-containing protein [Emcibacter nanhaiensis]|uniref:DUF4105 domain-containing protein n=1 Tax=Emcibacter nanhaiensis TaxID=1505037 RepID=A0A501PRN6_9PROT|nr:DUF4105 domain-containing protein [Emcibacter nanhaiensis]TPD62624.1 DUF4105 domain-containing protein [Emcibacter nanhaiensis]
MARSRNRFIGFLKYAAAILSGLVIGLWIFLELQTPDRAGPWQPQLARTAFAEIEDEHIHLHNVRDFTYHADRSPDRIQYFDRSYYPGELKRIWYGISHFGPVGLAHNFLSFEFENGEYLSLSVETRLHPGEHYGAFRGMLRQFNKIYVWATEQDIIGQRTHVRGEHVMLYPVMIEDKRVMQAYFLKVITETNELHNSPDFYNTLFDSCLTNLIKNTPISDETYFIDFRILLPGRADRLAYKIGLIPDDIPLEDGRKRAAVRLNGLELDETYSDRIRCGWAGYNELGVQPCPAAD